MPASPHHLRLGRASHDFSDAPEPEEWSRPVLAWLSALTQAEHLNLLVGSGLTAAVAAKAGVTATGMAPVTFELDGSDGVARSAAESAKLLGRGEPNIEDHLRAAMELLGGLAIDDPERAGLWREAINTALRGLAVGVLESEQDLRTPLHSNSGPGADARSALIRFLLAFAHRSASRDRLHVFTTNYDRLVELGCDLGGIRCLDRFVGALEPVFRASRLDVDLHYNPPGMRGEPRYLEGVVRLSKLHGSLDWCSERGGVRRASLPFGASADHPAMPPDPLDSLLIYPNAAKDVETLQYPYAEIFRDASAAWCRPNTTLVTYGYGFGDDHVNRVIADMLTIPSTHLVVISFDWAGGRLVSFLDKIGHGEQTTLMIGEHFAELGNLTDHYLPSPSLDWLTAQQREWEERHEPAGQDAPITQGADGG